MSEMGSIVGVLVNQRDDQALAEAKLEVTGQGVQQDTLSGGKGEFKFADLPPGEYELTVTHPGFENGLYGPLIVVPSIQTELKLALAPSLV